MKLKIRDDNKNETTLWLEYFGDDVIVKSKVDGKIFSEVIFEPSLKVRFPAAPGNFVEK